MDSIFNINNRDNIINVNNMDSIININNMDNIININTEVWTLSKMENDGNVESKTQNLRRPLQWPDQDDLHHFLGIDIVYSVAVYIT